MKHIDDDLGTTTELTLLSPVGANPVVFRWTHTVKSHKVYLAHFNELIFSLCMLCHVMS